MLRRFHVPLTKPEDIIPHLAKQELHWKERHSAQELVLAWSNAPDGIPASVRRVIGQCHELSSMELVDGFFEREVDLRTRGRNSQTDLMAVVAWGDQLGIIAVEGKVDEPFGELVSVWNDGSEGKTTRLEGLRSTLCIDTRVVGGLRYQLLHRAVSAVYEAERYRCRRAIVLIHSFSPTKKWFEDFARFSDVMGIGVNEPDTISPPKQCGRIELRLAWVSDRFWQSTPEVILEIGAEGGSITLYGLPHGTGWRYSTSTVELFDGYEESEHRRNSGWVDSWDAALRLIDRYPWHRLYALTVHPQFRERVWTTVQLRFARDEPPDHHALARWSELCSEKLI